MRASRNRPTSDEPGPARLVIEFDACHLAIETDVPGGEEFVRDTYALMLARREQSVIGTVRVAAVKDGISIDVMGQATTYTSGLEPLMPLLREEILMAFMRGRPDLLWLHAASVVSDGRASLIVGSSGSGKSTMATRLCEKGWSLMSDDVAPIRMKSNEVLPFLQAPFRRIATLAHAADSDVPALPRERVVLQAGALWNAPCKIGTLIFPRYVHGAGTTIRRMNKGEAAFAILRHARNIVDHQAAAASRAAELARQFKAFELEYGASIEAISLLEEAAC